MQLKRFLLPVAAAFCVATMSAQEIDWTANYALGKPIVGRFTQIDYPRVVDGDNATQFNDNPPANNIENWVIIDLGQSREISNVGIQHGTDDGRYPKEITVYAMPGVGEDFDMTAFADANRVEKNAEDKWQRANNIFADDARFVVAATYTKTANVEPRFDNIELTEAVTTRYVAVYFGNVEWGSNIAEVLVINRATEASVATSMTVSASNNFIYGDLRSATLEVAVLDQYGRPMTEVTPVYETEGVRRHDDGSLSFIDGYNRGSVTVTVGDLSETVGFVRADADRYLFDNSERNAAIIAGVNNSVYTEGTPANMFTIDADPSKRAMAGHYKVLPNDTDRDSAVELLIPFPTAANVDGISLIWSGGYPKDYTVEVSADGETYTRVAEYTDHASIAGGQAAADMMVVNAKDVKFVKINVTRLGTGYGLELAGFKAYGSWSEADRFPATIAITPERSEIYEGESVKVSALVKDQFNERVENANVIWSTNNGEIVDGVLSSAVAGEAVVTAKVNDAHGELIEATASVMVLEAPVATAIRVNASSTVFTGDVTSATINPVVIDQYGNAVDGASEISIAAGEGINIADNGTITLAEGSKSGFITITAGDIVRIVRFAELDTDTYLFDDAKYDNIKDNTAAHISWSDNVVSTTAKSIVDGTAVIDDEAEESRGQIFTVTPTSTDYAVDAEVIVPFYDPANLDAIALTWDGAYPADYKVSVTTDYSDWTVIANIAGHEPVAATTFATDLFAVGIDEVRAVKVEVSRAGSGYGIKLADFKAYGTYVEAVAGSMSLDPYVLVQYNDKMYSHPTTVAFHKVVADEANLVEGSEAETVYLRPVLLDNRHSAPMVPHTAYSVNVTNHNSGEAAAADAYTLDLEAMSVAFQKPGTYDVEVTYGEGDAAVVGKTTIVTVHHNKMVTNTHASVSIYDAEGNALSECPKNAYMTPAVLMEGRTSEEGGVRGSLMVGNYDILVDFGRVLEIPAVEIYWEGACAVGYDVIFGQTTDEIRTSYQNKNYHWTLNTDRRAEVDRPRLDRIAVNMAENALKGGATEPEPQAAPSLIDVTSPRAIRYILLTNIAPDPAQIWTVDAPHKWDAKLSEITPYYDPELVTEDDLVPTGIETIVSGSDAPVEYFTLQGIRVSRPAAGSVVIRRQGTTVEKILVR